MADKEKERYEFHVAGPGLDGALGADFISSSHVFGDYVSGAQANGETYAALVYASRQIELVQIKVSFGLKTSSVFSRGVCLLRFRSSAQLFAFS